MDDNVILIETAEAENNTAETSYVDVLAEQYEVETEMPEFDSSSSNRMTMDEIVVSNITSDTAETVEISVEEAVGWAGGDNTIHDNLAGRDAPDQHPIVAITGLRAELDQIEALQTVYSDKKQQADYYLWRQDTEHPLPANPYGLFVSIYPETDKIQICDGTSDVFGVTVADAAFVGNQEYAQADGGTKTGRDGNYCLVMHSGLVAVRRMPSVVVGDYVVPNSRGEAEKSNGDYGYLVTAVSDADGLYAIISLSDPSTLAKKTADSVGDLSGRMTTAEYNITSVTNVANSAYALAKDAKENAEVNSEYIEEKITEVIGRMDKIDGEEGIVDILNQSINNACTDAALAKTIAQDAVSEARQIGDDAYASANEAIAAIKDIGAGSTSWAKRIDAYSVGEYSQAYGLTLEQAKSALEVGIVHIPTITHTEVYVGASTYEQEFSIGYHYEWSGEKWVPSLSTAVNFSSVYIAGSEQTPYWVVTDGDVEYNGAIYKLGYLYKWENGTWSMTGASIAENTLTRAVSAIHQTANELSMEVTNARGDAASLSARLEEDEAVVQGLVRWTGSEEGKYNIATTKMSADDDGAGIALVVVKDGTDEEIGGARIVLNDSDNGSYIQLDADKINFLSQEFNIYPSDGNGNIASTEPNFSVDEEGNVGIKGRVSADEGDIGGWQISETSLYSDGEAVGMSSDDKDANGEFDADKVAFWAGKNVESDPSFSVTHGGRLTSTSGNIGGWQIGDSGLAAGNVGLYSGEDKKYYAQNSTVRLYAGAPLKEEEIKYGYLISSVEEIQVKYFESYDSQEPYIGNGINMINGDTIVEFAFLEDGTPVLYKTDLSSFPETDYADQFRYAGQSELDGEVYDHWVKYEGGVARGGLYTNIIVETYTPFNSNFYVLDNGTMVAKEAQIEGEIKSRNYNHSKKIVSWGNDEVFIDIPNGYTTAVRNEADNTEVLGIKYNIEDDNTITIVGANLDETMEHVLIPSSYESLSVVKIADEAFADNTTIKSIVLPDSLKSIGDKAFSGCTTLQYIYLPDSTSVGKEAFSGCNNLVCFFSTLKEFDVNDTTEYDDAGMACKKEEVEIMHPMLAVPYSKTEMLDANQYQHFYNGDTNWSSISLQFYSMKCFINGIQLTSVEQEVYKSSSSDFLSGSNTVSMMAYVKADENKVYYKYIVEMTEITSSNVASPTNRINLRLHSQTVASMYAPIMYYSEIHLYDNQHWHYDMIPIGWKISSDINDNMINSAYFNVTHDGKITASDVDLSGTIKANRGNIGDLQIRDGSISSGDVGLTLMNNGLVVAQQLDVKDYLQTTTFNVGKICGKYNTDTFLDFDAQFSYDQENYNNIKASVYVTDQGHQAHPLLGEFDPGSATLTLTADHAMNEATIFTVHLEYQRRDDPLSYVVEDIYVTMPKGSSTVETKIDYIKRFYSLNKSFYFYLLPLPDVSPNSILMYASTITTKEIQCNGVFSPSPSTTSTLGTSNNKWDEIWCKNALNTSSDRNVKNSIENLPDRYGVFFDNLQPVRYKFNQNTSNRYHVGFISQDVELALNKAEIPTSDFAGFLAYDNQDGTKGYGLRYGEFIALNTYEIQKLKKLVKELKEEVKLLKTQQNDLSETD